jgi:hypothetical protein
MKRVALAADRMDHQTRTGPTCITRSL